MGVINVSIPVIVMLAIDVKNTQLTQLQNRFCINEKKYINADNGYLHELTPLNQQQVNA